MRERRAPSAPRLPRPPTRTKPRSSLPPHPSPSGTCGPRFRDKVDVDGRQPCPSPKREARISRLSVLARCPHALRRGQPGGRLASSAAGSQLPAGLRRWPPQHGLPVRPPPGAPARPPSSSLQLSGACSCGHAAPLRHGIRNLRDIFKEATRRVAAESAVVPRSPHPGGALSGEAAPACWGPARPGGRDSGGRPRGLRTRGWPAVSGAQPPSRLPGTCLSPRVSPVTPPPAWPPPFHRRRSQLQSECTELSGTGVGPRATARCSLCPSRGSGQPCGGHQPLCPLSPQGLLGGGASA